MNQNFEKWFKNSQVVNDLNEPKIVYHGTSAAFNSFCNSKKGSNTGWTNTVHGFFFLEQHHLALNFAAENNTGGNVHVIDAYLSIKKPIDLRQLSFFTKEDQAADLVEFMTNGDEMLPGHEALAWLDENVGLSEWLELPEITDSIDFNRFLVKKGYDGIISNFGDNNAEYVVFHPNQIKSASRNNGDFSLNSDNIYN